MKFRRFALVLAAVSLLTQIASTHAADVTFVLVNDIHNIDYGLERGGFARLAAVVEAEKTKGGTVIYAHAGDTLSPSLLSGLDQGAHIVEVLNMTPPDVFVPGNHEFDFGKDVFLARMSEARFGALLASNLRMPDGSVVPGFTDTLTIETSDGVKIGIVGVTADDALVTSSPGDLQFTPVVETARTEAAALREAGADIVVLVTHADRAQDMALYASGDYDLILTGDDHDLFIGYNGRTAIVESSEEANFVTAIDLTITVEEEDGRRSVEWTPNFRPIDTANVAPDPEIEARLEDFRRRLSEELDFVIARTEIKLDTRREAVRSGETVFGSIVADAMRVAVGADVAITNGGGIRGNKTYSVGSDISRRDILTELPFGNVTVLLEVTGADILAALENGFSDVQNRAGRFPHVSGMAVIVDLARPMGQRIVSVMIDGRPLDPAARYALATNDFMARGGDGYAPFAVALRLLNERDADLMANHVMAYMQELGTIAPMSAGRIVLR